MCSKYEPVIFRNPKKLPDHANKDHAKKDMKSNFVAKAALVLMIQK